MPIEIDDVSIRIFGNDYKGLQFYDDDRALQQEIYLESDDTLNVGGNGGGGGSTDIADLSDHARGRIIYGAASGWSTLNVGTANAVLTNNGTDVAWSTGFLSITAAKTLTVSNSLTLAGTDAKSLTLTGSLTIGADTTITGGGTVALGGFTLTVPDTGTVALQTYVAANYIKLDASNDPVTGDLDFADGIKINVDQIRARDGDGLALYDDGGNGIFVEDGGNVGIGTTGPGEKLHIYRSSAGKVRFDVEHAGGGTGDAASFRMLNNLSSHYLTAGIHSSGYPGNLLGIARADTAYEVSVGVPLIFGTYSNEDLYIGTNNITRVTIKNDGNVGINQTSPGAMLQIDSSAAATKGLIVKGAASQSANLLELQESDGTVFLASGDGLAGSEFVINSDGLNIDFRVESDNYDALFIDASNDSIDIMHNASGKIGFFAATPVTQQTELTDELTTITHTAPGTPDYAIQDLVDSGAGSAFGFATKDEGNSVLAVVANLQARVNELETKLVAYGLLVDAD